MTAETGHPLPQVADGIAGLTIAGRYRLVRLLGAGALGEVWVARDALLSRTVAVEIAGQRSDGERFLREARALAELRHPNVAIVHDAAHDDTVGVFVVFELVDGQPLSDLLRFRPLPPARVVVLGQRVASALAAAHERGIVHGDLGTASVLLSTEGIIKVADFGVARLASSAPSPDGRSALAIAADVRALGAILFEALTGSPPDGTGVLPEPVRATAPDLSRLLREMLRRDPAERPAAEAVKEDLAGLERGGGLKRRAGRKLSPLPLALVIAAIVPLVLGRLLVATPPRPTLPPAAAPEAEPLARRAISVRHLDADGWPEHFAAVRPVLGDVRLVKEPDGQLRIEASQGDADRAVSLLAVLDAFGDTRFSDGPNLFVGQRGAMRTVTCDARACPARALLFVASQALAWPVVFDDEEIADRPRDAVISGVPWDTALQALLEGADVRAVRFGRVWLLTSRSRALQIEKAEPPVGWVGRAPARALQQMAVALASARSDRGVIAVSDRLGAVLVADRIDAFAGYRAIWSALAGSPERVEPFPERRSWAARRRRSPRARGRAVHERGSDGAFGRRGGGHRPPSRPRPRP
ncbi:MAG: protein kinase [Acidobacteriota bacterium]